MCTPQSKRHLPHTKWLSEVKERMSSIFHELLVNTRKYVVFESSHECDAIIQLTNYYNTRIGRPLDSRLLFRCSLSGDSGLWQIESFDVPPYDISISQIVACMDVLFTRMWANVKLSVTHTAYVFESTLTSTETEILKHCYHAYLTMTLDASDSECLVYCTHTPWYNNDNYLFIRTLSYHPDGMIMLQKICPLFCCLACFTKEQHG